MKLAIACGGTGGHIFPGLATAEALRRRGHDIELWLAGKDVEKPALQDWSGAVTTIASEGLPVGFSFRGLRGAWKLASAARACRRRMAERRPAALLAMGSYASIGPAYAALRLGVPVVLHEANVLPGRAIRLLARWADATATSFEETRFYLRSGGLTVTGMPIRTALEESARTAPPPGGERDRFTVLVMGGSRGAHRLNEVAAEALVRVHAAGHRVRAVHLTGFADEASVRQRYGAAGVPHEVWAFTRDMAPIYRQADLAVCRSGAATCAELSVFAVPALLVPYPSAVGDHQTANARALEKLGAADVVPERDLGADWLADYLVSALRQPGRLARQSAAARQRALRSGAEELANLVERVAKGRHERSP